SGSLGYQAAGVYAVTIVAFDGANTSSLTFPWTVANINRAPSLANPGSQTNWAYALYAGQVRSDGALRHWRLDTVGGTTTADSISGGQATVAGGVTTGQAGALADGNPAFRFNGVNACLQAPNPALPPTASLTDDLTLELWVNPVLGGRQTLVSK